MRYESVITKNGNVGVSYNSQSAAEAQAVKMEVNGCSRCSGCSDCYSCYGCSDCSRCSGCSGCYGCSRCSRCSRCSDCSDCSDCYGCYGCYSCYGCSDCSGILVWRGPKAEKLIAINGLIWPVTTDGINIQIGCQQHTVEDWQVFDDARIGRMDSRALEFWKQFKATVLAMAEYRRSL